MKGEKPGAIYDGEFSQDGKLIVTAGAPFHAIVWESETGKVVQTFSVPTNYPNIPFYAVAFSPDNKQVLTAGENLSMQLWDVETGNLVDDTKLHGVRGITWFPDDEKVLIRIQTRTAIYSLKMKEILFQVDGTGTLSSDGNEMRIINGWIDGNRDLYQLEIWNTNIYESIRKDPSFILKSGEKLSVSPNGKRVMIGKSEASVEPTRIIDATTAVSLRNYTSVSVETDEVDLIEFSPDGQRVANVHGNKILIYDISDLGAAIHNGQIHESDTRP